MDKNSKIKFAAKVLEKSNAYSSVGIWERKSFGATEMDSIRAKVRDAGGIIQMGGNRVLAKSIGHRFNVVNEQNMKGNKLLVVFNGGFEACSALKKALKMEFFVGQIDGVNIEVAEFDFASKFASRDQVISTFVGSIQSPIAMLAMCLKMYYEKMEGKS